MAKNTNGNAWNSTLKRKSNLKRAPWSRSKRPKNFAKEHGHTQAPQPTSKQKRLKQMSAKLRKKLTHDYMPVNRAFLQLPENRYCWICIGRQLNLEREEVRKIMAAEDSEATLRSAYCHPGKATEVHHRNGRVGRLLVYEPLFVASCFGCRQWPHENLREARRLDFIAPRAQYDVFPEKS